MEFDFGFLIDLPVWDVLMYIVIAILVDTVFGVLVAIQKGEFKFVELPRFLGTNVLPYVFGLLVLAVVAEYTTEVFEYVFYVVSAAVLARYVAKLWKKIKVVFGVEID